MLTGKIRTTVAQPVHVGRARIGQRWPSVVHLTGANRAMVTRMSGQVTDCGTGLVALRGGPPVPAGEAVRRRLSSSRGVAPVRSAQRGTSGAATGGGGPQAPPIRITVRGAGYGAGRGLRSGS